MHRQPIPVAGILSDLEVAMERCYNEHIMDIATQEKKALQEKPGTKPSPSSKPPRLKNIGRGETIKIHLKKVALGQDWTHVPPKDKGPDVGKCYEPPPRQEGTGVSQASGSQKEANQAGRSPLTDELLALGEDVTTVLDYQYNTQEDPEIAQAVAHIPPCTEINAPPGFEPNTLTTLCWAPFSQLRHKKIRCWMRSPPKRKSQAWVDRELKRTLVVLLSTNKKK